MSRRHAHNSVPVMSHTHTPVDAQGLRIARSAASAQHVHFLEFMCCDKNITVHCDMVHGCTQAPRAREKRRVTFFQEARWQSHNPRRAKWTGELLLRPGCARCLLLRPRVRASAADLWRAQTVKYESVPVGLPETTAISGNKTRLPMALVRASFAAHLQRRSVKYKF